MVSNHPDFFALTARYSGGFMTHATGFSWAAVEANHGLDGKDAQAFAEVRAMEIEFRGTFNAGSYTSYYGIASKIPPRSVANNSISRSPQDPPSFQSAALAVAAFHFSRRAEAELL